MKLSKIAAARPISACPARQNKKETEYNIILYNASLEEERRKKRTSLGTQKGKCSQVKVEEK